VRESPSEPWRSACTVIGIFRRLPWHRLSMMRCGAAAVSEVARNFMIITRDNTWLTLLLFCPASCLTRGVLAARIAELSAKTAVQKPSGSRSPKGDGSRKSRPVAINLPNTVWRFGKGLGLAGRSRARASCARAPEPFVTVGADLGPVRCPNHRRPLRQRRLLIVKVKSGRLGECDCAKSWTLCGWAPGPEPRGE